MPEPSETSAILSRPVTAAVPSAAPSASAGLPSSPAQRRGEQLRLVQQLGDVHPGECRRHQTVRAERAEPADQLRVGEHGNAPMAPAGRLERRAGVGDDHEVPAGLRLGQPEVAERLQANARRWLSVSMVEPDLLAITTTVRRSRDACAARSVVSP